MVPIVDFPERFSVVGADLSMLRPGFARVHCERGQNGQYKLSDVNLTHVPNKPRKKNKTDGAILNEITSAMNHFFPTSEVDEFVFFVREEQLQMYHGNAAQSRTIISLSKVVGLSDAFLWRKYPCEFAEIHPKTVKKILTGNATAEKEEVAAALDKYVGPQNYACDDESDALAVAIAWLISQGVISPDVSC